MADMDRREFVKTVAVGGAVFSLASALWPAPLKAAPGQVADIGECKRINITSVSEVGWWDTGKLISELKAGGGPKECNQWTTAWDINNGAGSSSLIEVEGLDGKVTRILLDTGWNPTYMTWRYQMTGVDRLLQEGKIDYLVISHEHLDHFWGLEATLRYDSKVTMVIPSTFTPKAHEFMGGVSFSEANAENTIQHQGDVMVMGPEGVHKLFEGAGLAVFEVPIILKIKGEQSLFFNVKDKGLVLVTGCCHQNIITFSDFAKEKVKGGDTLYGLYGGLHIAPFGKLGEEQEGWVRGMAKYNFQKVASNHCTGLPAVELMKELGYPVVGGRGCEGSMSNLYVGNGDSVSFG